MEPTALAVHELKIWPEYFASVISGEKTYELRRNDRNFAVGDHLRLLEFDPKSEAYSGRSALAKVLSVAVPNHLGGNVFDALDDGYCIMSISLLFHSASRYQPLPNTNSEKVLRALAEVDREIAEGELFLSRLASVSSSTSRSLTEKKSQREAFLARFCEVLDVD
jgi:hypothetical protein